MLNTLWVGAVCGTVIFKKTCQSLSLLHILSDRIKQFVWGCFDPLFSVDRKMSSTDIAGNSKWTNDRCNPFRHAGSPSPSPFVKGRQSVLSQRGKKRYLGKWVYAPHPQVQRWQLDISSIFKKPWEVANMAVQNQICPQANIFKTSLGSLLDQFTERWLRTLGLFFTYSLHRESDSISYELISSQSTNSYISWSFRLLISKNSILTSILFPLSQGFIHRDNFYTPPSLQSP